MEIINAPQFVKDKNLIGKPVFIELVKTSKTSQTGKISSNPNLRYGLVKDISEFSLTVLLWDNQQARIDIEDIAEGNIKIRDLKIVEDGE